MRARLKSSAILHKPSDAWVRAGVDYEAEWSPKMVSPPRVLVMHPERSDVLVELPRRFVQIVPDARDVGIARLSPTSLLQRRAGR